MATKTRRKANTAMVFNPSRGLSIGGRSGVRKTRSARKNPVRKTAAKVNPRKRVTRRRKHNPSSVTGLVVTAVMAGIGVTVFDVITARVIPQTSSLVRLGVKLGGAWLFQSSLGSKVPFLGKYKNDIALVLLVSGVIDIGKLYVLPAISPIVGNILGPGAQSLIDAPAGDGTTGGLWDNSYNTQGWHSAGAY